MFDLTRRSLREFVSRFHTDPTPHLRKGDTVILIGTPPHLRSSLPLSFWIKGGEIVTLTSHVPASADFNHLLEGRNERGERVNFYVQNLTPEISFDWARIESALHTAANPALGVPIADLASISNIGNAIAFINAMANRRGMHVRIDGSTGDLVAYLNSPPVPTLTTGAYPW